MEHEVGHEAEPAAAFAESSERLLISKLRRKDPAAFEALVKQHQDRVYDFCMRMLSDREEAFDVTQEIFVSIHQHLESFRQDAKISTWIFRISRNHCLNRLKYLKRRGRGRSDEYGETSEQAINESVGAPTMPDESLDAARARALVHKAIARLDEDQRVLVVLRDIEGLSYDEIVEITELAEGTVKSRLHRAREKLAVILGDLEAEAVKKGE
ncbi:MAG: sigma-70 family RNA polymerase sigma factor [Myxococcaceae bacterium]|nr:sigma-70 family RNA polymerase sigma factor [Myxococcaceae bacterium]